MPGTIQVSADGASSICFASTNRREDEFSLFERFFCFPFILWFSLCLRVPVGNDVDVSAAAVTAGKREYQTVGKMEITFSIFVNANNKGSCRLAEFKTLSVVEKGMLDDTCPLEGGGTVRVRLQFLLSEEERLRIHELVS
ncbi:hypothetical protein BHE74_00018381 [Ensete ventricosum]|nr:hypothetical protein BHE74_00018381 [Ensete ventricosum]RZR85366.1 hypothetical protein BHM03_00012338 [Ensete ventricosum]